MQLNQPHDAVFQGLPYEIQLEITYFPIPNQIAILFCCKCLDFFEGQIVYFLALAFHRPLVKNNNTFI